MMGLRLSLAVLCLLLAGCVWQPITYDEPHRVAVEQALVELRREQALQPFFDEARGYAVFPGSWRAGTGFGGAFGMGWLFTGEEVVGRVSMVEFFAGADLGVQAYRSILFFRTEKSLRNFRKGSFEFTGQANLAHVVGGKSAAPSYHPDVAMFVQVRGGLLLEASVGTQRYDVFPLAGEKGTDESE